MKNGLLVWNVLLTIAAGYLLFAHFTRKNDTPDVKEWAKDSVSASKPFRLAYFEMDSVKANTYMVKDVQAEIEKR